MTLVGNSVPMAGALEKVTGAVSYAVNIEFPGQLCAKGLRSPYPHARLLRIDAARAAALPGVRAVVTRDDLAGLHPCFGTGVEDQPVVVIDKARYAGDIVAAVAADSREIAEEALALIETDYEELPAVTDILAAAKPDAPIVQPNHVNKNAGGNIHGVYRAASGDIEQGFKESDLILEHCYTLPPVQHGHIEPHTAAAYWEPSGKLVIHSPCQTPSPLQDQLARVFGLPLNRVRVIVPAVGGGYGGKNHARIEPVVALLARKARRPVQWTLTREEVFLTGRRFGALIMIKTGVKRDGRLWARKVDAYYDMGAYALSGPANTRNACVIAGGPYNIPHRDYTTYAVYTNLPPAGPYRGVGASHVCWAYESEMDDIARRLNMDPVEIRLRNLLQENDRFITGEPMISVGVSECLRQAARRIGWRAGEEQPAVSPGPVLRGRGVAVAIKSTSTPSTSAASVRLNADGSAVLLTSSAEIGQGARTSLAQIVGDVLGLPLERISVTFPDTDVTPYDKSTSSSRTTFHMGRAAQLAAGQIRDQLLQAGAGQLEARIEDLQLQDMKLTVRGVPERSLSFPQLFRVIFGEAGGSLFGHHTLRTEGGVDGSGRGKGSSFWFYSAAAAEVEVDSETGKVRVLRVVTAVDAGKAIHPKQFDLQNEGSALAGLGSALFEEMRFDGGQPINGSFADYLLPSTQDHPAEFDSVLVETPHPDGPFGAKGIGEAALPPMAAAIGNAVANALGGARVRDLPIKPDKVIAALAAGKKDGDFP
jgi:carbon-monoxide dehydrogenase large subunit